MSKATTTLSAKDGNKYDVCISDDRGVIELYVEISGLGTLYHVVLGSVPTLADKLRNEIPWGALRYEIRWVAWSPYWGTWRGYTIEPHDNLRGWTLPPGSGDTFSLSGVAMPGVDIDEWRDTLVQRPEDE